MIISTIFIPNLLINKVQVCLTNSLIVSEILLTVLAVNRVSMITHKGSLLELGTRRAGEQHPPGQGGDHAQQVGAAGGGHVSVVAWHLPRTGELISTHNLELKFISILLVYYVCNIQFFVNKYFTYSKYKKVYKLKFKTSISY